MKTKVKILGKLVIAFCAMFLLIAPNTLGQRKTKQAPVSGNETGTIQEFQKDLTPSVLDQNITIFAENEPLTKVIQRICNYLKIDYKYNSGLLNDQSINLNVSNQPLKYVLSQLMKDFYLLFDIQDNILIIRDYVPLKESRARDNNMRNNPEQTGFVFANPRKKSVTLKFKTSSNLIIIPVAINQSDTLNFILDTGVRHPIITELPYVNKLNLNYLQPIDIVGLGEGDQLTAYRSENNQISISGLVSANQEIQMIINEDFQISHILGIPVHGLIGFNLFKDYVVKIDYQTQSLTLEKPEYFKYEPKNKDIVLPLVLEENKPFVTTKIVTDKNEEVPVKLLVDTGASDALWLSAKSDSRISIPESHIDTYLGKGLSGDLFGTKGRIGAIWVGPLVLYEPIVAFPENALIDGVIGKNGRNGTLGAEILRRFDVTIDYPNNRLILRPNDDIKDAFNYNMSGLEVTNPMPGYPIFLVSNVQKNSPAFYAGIQENDQIISLNNYDHKALTLNDINLLFQSREEKKIKMTVIRSGAQVKTEFLLKRMF